MSGVMLGGILLSGFEVPEQISFGGSQLLAVHRLPGGVRVVDAMGADDRDISWSGMMIGPNAADRARALDGLRAAGQMVPLVFGDMSFNVVVASFEAAYRRASWIGSYRISCLVVPGVAVQAPSLVELLTGALSGVGAIDPDGAVAGLAAAVGAAQADLLAAGTLVAGTAGTIALANSVQAAGSVAVAAQAGAESTMSGLIAVAAVNDGAVGGTAGLQLASLQASWLAKSGAAAGMIGCAAGQLAMGAA